MAEVSRLDDRLSPVRASGDLMSKHSNVHPGHDKAAGRDRQGENVVHEVDKQQAQRVRSEEENEPKRHASPEPGISNRTPADVESRERKEHPPVDTSSPPPEDAAGRVGEEPLEDRRDRHTSHKAGSRSIAQKEAGSRYPDRSMPASRKVAGAFGREPQR
jgi:hypothetical protein